MSKSSTPNYTGRKPLRQRMDDLSWDKVLELKLDTEHHKLMAVTKYRNEISDVNNKISASTLVLTTLPLATPNVPNALQVFTGALNVMAKNGDLTDARYDAALADAQKVTSTSKTAKSPKRKSPAKSPKRKSPAKSPRKKSPRKKSSRAKDPESNLDQLEIDYEDFIRHDDMKFYLIKRIKNPTSESPESNDYFYGNPETNEILLMITLDAQAQGGVEYKILGYEEVGDPNSFFAQRDVYDLYYYSMAIIEITEITQTRDGFPSLEISTMIDKMEYIRNKYPEQYDALKNDKALSVEPFWKS